jgi:hypothetical protein
MSNPSLTSTGTGNGYQSASELVQLIARDPALQQKIQEDPVATLASLASPQIPDTFIYRVVVLALGSAVLITLVGFIMLSLYLSAIPEGLVALGSAAVGALAGLLAPSPAQGRQ